MIKKPLLDEGVFTPEWLGLIGSGFSIGYALGKLVNGFLADHANVRRFFAAGVLMSALLNLAMLGFVSPWAWVDLVGVERVVPGRRLALQRGGRWPTGSAPTNAAVTTASSAVRIPWEKD